MKIDIARVLDIIRGIDAYFEDRYRSGRVREKGAEDYVTETDTAVQKYMYERLSEAYSQVQFMAEEKDNAEIDFSGDIWILDPVDGTKNLIRDYRASALSLAYMESGELTFGAVYQPYLRELFYAQKGVGAFLNGEPIRVSALTQIEHALVGIGTTPFDRSYEEKNLALISKTFRMAADVRRFGSAAMELAWIAAGRSDAFFEAELKPWDVAAGTLLIKEAGGKVRDFSGKELDFTKTTSILAGNGVIDEELLRVVRQTV